MTKVQESIDKTEVKLSRIFEVLDQAISITNLETYGKLDAREFLLKLNSRAILFKDWYKTYQGSKKTYQFCTYDKLLNKYRSDWEDQGFYENYKKN